MNSIVRLFALLFVIGNVIAAPGPVKSPAATPGPVMNENNKVIGVWDFLDFGKKDKSLDLGSFNMPAIHFGF